MKSNPTLLFVTALFIAIISYVFYALIMLWAWKTFLAETFPDISVNAGTFFGVLLLSYTLRHQKQKDYEEATMEKLIWLFSATLTKILLLVILILAGKAFF